MIVKKEDGAFYKTMGRRLHLLRKMKKISLEQAAHHLNVSTYLMHRYETGLSAIPVVRLVRLCDLLRTCIFDVVCDEEKMIATISQYEILAAFEQLDKEMQEKVFYLIRQLAIGSAKHQSDPVSSL